MLAIYKVSFLKSQMRLASIFQTGLGLTFSSIDNPDLSVEVGYHSEFSSREAEHGANLKFAWKF